MNKFYLEQITEYQYKQCELFAEYSVSTSVNQYKKRMQFNIDKIKKDIFYGKTAEFMVYNYLIKAGKNPTTPDLNIYIGKNKSYDADIALGDNNLHVKSHLINNNFPVSWLFQKNDPLIINKNKNDFLVLVVINNDDDRNFMYVLNINDVSFKEPIKESLRQSKLCLYESDLKKCN